MPSADSEVRSFVVGQPADRGRRSGHPTEVLRPGWVEVAGDRVVAVGSGGPDRPADAAYPDGTMLPGFVDIHLHGGERPGGLDAVRHLATEGVTVAVGHTEADYQLTLRAIEADAMSAAGMSDGQYTLGTLDVVVTDGTARLPSGSIAGSTATTADLFAAAYEALRGRSEALLGATQVSASTPAAALGLDMVGMLSPGHRADLVVLGGGGTPAGAMAAGHWVHAPHRRAPLVRSGAEPARARHRRSPARPHSP